MARKDSRRKRKNSGTGTSQFKVAAQVSRSTISSRLLVSSYQTKFGLYFPYERGEVPDDGAEPAWNQQRCPSRLDFREGAEDIVRRSPRRSPVARSVSQQGDYDQPEDGSSTYRNSDTAWKRGVEALVLEPTSNDI